MAPIPIVDMVQKSISILCGWLLSGAKVDLSRILNSDNTFHRYQSEREDTNFFFSLLLNKSLCTHKIN